MIPIPVALLIAGTAMIGLGLWVHHRLMKAANDYRLESDHPSGREAADRGTGLALAHTWLLIAVGLGAVGLALYLAFVGGPI